MTHEEGEALIADAIKNPRAYGIGMCLLHPHRRGKRVGIFIPFSPMLWGAPPAKDRTFLYTLCSRCAENPKTIDLVEEVIMSNVNKGETKQ